ncbi:MAG: prolyl oligopeptidase family serine peptidase, partial [Opitutaceae bacterium]|nr:prolyl oligopeptidase family serine peptidase [Opitutaceae bacterium]
LTTRSDVDSERIGVTGISGGGAVSFWLAAADERLKVAVPISGMADLPSYLSDQVINEHCDCMFMHNTYEWSWGRIGAMVAPRPLLFVNSNQDPIFPMNANERVINRLESFYSLFGAGDRVDSVVSIGGHAYREDVRKATYRFMNIYLKNDSSSVNDSEVDLVTGNRGEEIHPIDPENLRVFPQDSDLPKDAVNSTIDRHFVPMVDLGSPETGEFKEWKENLLDKLREVTFRGFPKRIPSATLQDVGSDGSMLLETESGIDVRLRLSQKADSRERILLVVNLGDPEDVLQRFAKETDEVYVIDPRGVGETSWTLRNPPNFVARSHALLGRTVDDGRVWDIAATARFLIKNHGGNPSLHIVGEGAGAVLGAYAMLLEPEINGAILDRPQLSHMDESSPALLNVLRVCDVPDALGALAPRSLTIRGLNLEAEQKVSQAYKASGVSGKLIQF